MDKNMKAAAKQPARSGAIRPPGSAGKSDTQVRSERGDRAVTHGQRLPGGTELQDGVTKPSVRQSWHKFNAASRIRRGLPVWLLFPRLAVSAILK